MIFLHSFHYFCKAAVELLHLCNLVANFCITVSFKTSLCMAHQSDSVGTKPFCCSCHLQWPRVTWLTVKSQFSQYVAYMSSHIRSRAQKTKNKKNLVAHNLIWKKGLIEKIRNTWPAANEWGCAFGSSVCTHRGRADTSSALISHTYTVWFFFFRIVRRKQCGNVEASDGEK